DPTCPITAEFAKQPSPFALSPTRLVQLTKAPTGMVGWELLKSSPYSWGQDFASALAGTPIQPPPRNEWRAQTLAVAVGKAEPIPAQGAPPPTEKVEGTRLVVFGNDSLIQDSTLVRSQPAVQLMLNSVNWLVQQEDMIAVARREVKGTPIVLSES